MMTESYTYGFNIWYSFPKHVNAMMKDESFDDFNDKGIATLTGGFKSNRDVRLYLTDVSASEAVKRLLWALTHIASLLNDFNNKSLDFLAMRLITEAIRNLLLTTEGKGIKLKEWFKADDTMRVVIFGKEDSKLYVTLDRTPKNPRVHF